ncbi:MAG: NCS2 family permease [Lachnospiraceae bacterium]|nr:NCS2 family permease [Lachnospiraceae bacterium]
MERLFHLKERGTNVKTEIIAGTTTFLAMAYILAVNPNILGTVMDANGVFVATALASAVATFIMGVWANYPIALSAGLGINAYFAYTVCIGELNQFADPSNPNESVPNAWMICLTAVFVEGLIFMFLSLFKVREKLINEINGNLKLGITSGIGFFIAFIGMQDAKIIISDPSTIVGLGSFRDPAMVLAIVGVIIIVVMAHYKVRGAVLIGILSTWILGMIAEGIGWYKVDVEAGVSSVFPSSIVSLDFSGLANTAFKFDFRWVGDHLIMFIAVIVSFLYVDLFDTIGTVVGVASKAGLLDKKGEIPRVERVLMADAIGTTVGACLGTSPVTSFVESSAGVAEGGKTGLTAITTGLWFLLALVFSPLFLAIPSFAIAPALIYVGMLVVSSVTQMKFDQDPADTLGGYMAMVMMPLSYSIATGIMFAMLTWVIVKVLTGKAKDVSLVMWGVFVIFLLRIVALAADFS